MPVWTDILDRLDLGIAVLDHNGTVLHWNSWLIERLPASVEAAIGRTLPEIFADQLEPYVLKSIERVLRLGWANRLSHALHPRPFPLVHRNSFGEQDVKQAVDLSPITLADGAHGCLIQISDVTEMVRREQSLRQQATIANSANRAKSEFLASMSHELRTPLNAVLGYAQILQFNSNATLNDRDLQQVRHIEQSGRHLLALIDGVLELSAIEARRVKINIETLFVAKIIDDLNKLTAPMAAKNQIRMIFPAHNKAFVRADELRLSQCLINLVSNAIKYNRKGGTVWLDVAPVADDRLRFSVTDTGIGIPEQMQPLVFQAFQRLGAERMSIEGTGIGLSLVKQLVGKMGGEVGFNSTEGIGSTFWIELPRGGPLASDTGRAAGRGSATPHAGATQMTSLLYVEDTPSNLQLMEHVVARIGDVRMLSAPTPSLGLELAAAHQPSVIVLDINLPEMDGYEMLRRLATMPETRQIPVLALSAAALPTDIARGKAAGFFDYLTKPLDIPAFLRSIEAALSQDTARPC